MKIGIRKPSIKRRIKARTTGRIKRKLKSSVNPLYGKKGMGYINNPKKALYNKVYNKTTIGVNTIVNSTNYKGKKETTNIKINSNDSYTIINDNLVIIDNKEYSRGFINFLKILLFWDFIFFLFFGFICLPFGIILLLIALIFYYGYKKYKIIYNEMIKLKNENN